MRRLPPSWEPGNGSAASAPPRLTVWSHERGVREAASEHESEPPEICVRRVMVPFGLHTGLTPPIVWHTCTWTCEHAGLADLLGSRPNGRHHGEVGWRTRFQSCDVRVHRSTDCGTNVNTVPRMGRQQERSEGVLVSVDYIRSRPPSARMDKHDGGRLMGMRPRREGALPAEVEFTAIQCGVYSCVHLRVLVRVRHGQLVSAAAGLCVFPGVCGCHTA